MTEYRWVARDLLTDEAIAELPLTSATISDEVVGAGAFSADLLLTGTTADGQDLGPLLTAATTPERVLVLVERNGVLLPWSAIVWKRTRGMGAPTQLAGAGLWSFFRRQHLRQTLTYSGTDQLAIARGIVNAAQAVIGADAGLVVGTETSGVLRTRTYQSYEFKQAAEAVEQLAAVENGFDFAVQITTDGARRFVLGYPRIGRRFDATGVVFATGKNVIDWKLDEDGTRSAREVNAVGAGDGSAALRSTATRTDLIDAGYPMTSEVLALKDVSVQATLDEHARRAVDARAVTPMFWRVRVKPDDVDAGLGTWQVGDDAVLEVTDPVAGFSPGADGSPGYRAVHRILAATLSVRDGVEELWCTLGDGTALRPESPGSTLRETARRLQNLEARS